MKPRTFPLVDLLIRSLLLLSVFCFWSCKESKSPLTEKSQEPLSEPAGFRAYRELWNVQIKEKLLHDQKQAQQDLTQLNTLDLNTLSKIQKLTHTYKIQTLNETLETLHNRLSDGDYFQFKTTKDIPSNLVWENGLNEPDIGDPKAIKGGSLTLREPVSYPSTFRHFGPNTNNSFRVRFYDEILLKAVGLHPVTRQVIPAVCSEWALSPDGRTVYYRIDPEARYTDGHRVKPADFMLTIYLRTSEFAQNPFEREHYRNEISAITVYDDSTFSVTLPRPKPLMAYKAALYPSPSHFYAQFGADFVTRYQWLIEPTTGAYTIAPDDYVRGRQITFTRVKNWWAQQKKYYHYAYNVDTITYLFMAEEAKALELFKAGQIDMYLMNKPDLWHEFLEIPEVHNGYIEKNTFYTNYPRYPVGLYLNTARPPFDNLSIRLGFQHAMNMEKVNDIIHRGDYQRLDSYCSGFGRFTQESIKARSFSPTKAREYFAQAGFTESGNDGILRNAQGEKLSIELTFSATNPSIQTTMSILKEEAKKAGLELRLDDLDGMVSYRKVMEKRHQATFWAWEITPPHPNIHSEFHSSQAYDDKGNPIPHSKNITSTADIELDQALEAERSASNEDSLQQASHKAQQRIHDLAVWVPGYNAEFSRLASWRWVRWPQSETTPFCHPLLFEPAESHLYWIDPLEKDKTLKEKKENISFPEVDNIHDKYRRSR